MKKFINLYNHEFLGGGSAEKDFPFFINRMAHASVGEHRHDAYEFFLVTKGSAVHLVNGKPEKIAEGDLLFINLSMAHGFEMAPGVAFEIINVLFLPGIFVGLTAGSAGHIWKKSFLEPFFLPRHTLHLGALERQRFLWVLEEILSEFLKKERHYQRVISSLMIYFLELVARRYLAAEKDAVNSPGRFVLIQSYIADHFTSEITLNHIAKNFQLSVPYLSAAYKKNFGLPFKAFLTSKRVEYAKFLLRTSRRQISEISREAGFENLSSFERAFKKKVGLSPSDFRSG